MDNTNNLFTNLQYELVNIILEYDGRIKYDDNKDKYINIIHKYDNRYCMITPIIIKKLRIIEDTFESPVDNSFYFEFPFDNQPNIVLCYDYNWSFNNEFEICYTNMKDSGIVFGSDQIRTVI